MKLPLTAGLGSLVCVLASLTQAAPLGSAFTYQGRLNEAGAPANGIYDLRFRLCDALTSGNEVALPLTNSAVAVSNGLFITTVDFGPGLYHDRALWLWISVRTNGTGSFIDLDPRQPLTPIPHALYSVSAAVAGTANEVSPGSVGAAAFQAGSVDSSILADGTIAASDLSPVLASNTFWRLGGNAGTAAGPDFLGTADDQAFELRVNGQRALRLEPNDASPNSLAGHSSNAASNTVYGATIGGGGSAGQPNKVDNNFGTVAGGARNTAAGEYGTIAGGFFNRANGFASVIAGGWGNQVGAQYNTVGGGFNNANLAGISFIGGGGVNTNRSGYAVIAGGYGNLVGSQADSSSIGGGSYNLIESNATGSVISGGQGNAISLQSQYASIPGGLSNRIVGGSYSFAAGRRASALNPGTFIWADSVDSPFSTTASNQFLVRAGGGVGIGTNNPQSELHVNGTVIANNFVGSGAGLTSLSAGSLSGTVADARLSANVPLLSAGKLSDAVLSANVALLNGSQTYTGAKSFSSPIHLNDGDIFFRGGADENHGVGWFGAGKEFAGVNVDGPVLYGCDGGGLGTHCNTALALRWKWDGNVVIDPTGANDGALLPGLTFGNGSGEGIASRRTAGGNQYGLDFYANSIVRFSIAQNGFVGIGTTNPRVPLDIAISRQNGPGLNDGILSIGPTNSWRLTLDGTGIQAKTGGDESDLSLNYFGGNVRICAGLLNVNRLDSRVGVGRAPTANKLEVGGNASKDVAGGWLANSDARIKTGIATVTNALATLDRVRLVNFHYTDDYRAAHPSIEDRAYLNVVAQEFQDVFPDFVRSSGEKLADGGEILQVDTYPLTIYSAAAIQELNQKVEVGRQRSEDRSRMLEERLQQKQMEITELKQRMEKLEALLLTRTGGAQ